MPRPTYTPGPGGYTLAVVASLFAFLVIIATVIAVGELEAWALIWVPYMGVFYGAIPAFVLGTPGAVAVHYACRHDPRQWVHVVAAGVAGLVAGLVLWSLILREPEFGLWVPALGIATAIGRAVVIPLVRPPAERARTANLGG